MKYYIFRFYRIRTELKVSPKLMVKIETSIRRCERKNIYLYHFYLRTIIMAANKVLNYFL